MRRSGGASDRVRGRYESRTKATNGATTGGSCVEGRSERDAGGLSTEHGKAEEREERKEQEGGGGKVGTAASRRDRVTREVPKGTEGTLGIRKRRGGGE